MSFNKGTITLVGSGFYAIGELLLVATSVYALHDATGRAISIAFQLPKLLAKEDHRKCDDDFSDPITDNLLEKGLDIIWFYTKATLIVGVGVAIKMGGIYLQDPKTISKIGSFLYGIKI